VEADFKGGNVSADGGVLLLREVDRRTGLIDQLAACFTDHRRADHEAIRGLLVRLAVSCLDVDTKERLRHPDATMFRAKADACVRGGWCACFRGFESRWGKSWSRARRAIGKAQVNPKGENPRFIVTNLPEDHALRQPERRYREFHCARGDAESKRSGDRLRRRVPEGRAQRVKTGSRNNSSIFSPTG
jgi:hypothetical protein